jgi:hypothetical protein
VVRCRLPVSLLSGSIRDDDLVGGVIAYTAAGVTGISNLFGAKLPAGQLQA